MGPAAADPARVLNCGRGRGRPGGRAGPADPMAARVPPVWAAGPCQHAPGGYMGPRATGRAISVLAEFKEKGN